jgi:hypothetical protein
VFESPIDALSYWSLHPQLKNAVLASIDGLKPQSVYNFINYLAMNHAFEEEGMMDKFQVFLGMDNDEKDRVTGVKSGQAFIQQFLETPIIRQQAPKFEGQRLFVANPPSVLFKDWNEELQFVRRVQSKAQYISPNRHQVANIQKQADGSYQLDFFGTDLPEEIQAQQTQFSVKNEVEAKKLLETYDFERISKGDLEKLGLDAFNRKETKQELAPEEVFETSL